MKTVVVEAYDPNWPFVFQQIRQSVSKGLGDTALAIEHIGSTSVPGLSAKPIIDIDVVVEGPTQVLDAILGLEKIGYRHRGNLGIEGREAFRAPGNQPRQHLYVCAQNSLPLRNHLKIRNALRSNPELAKEYDQLKRRLADAYRNDMERYMAGKTEFLLNILSRCGFLSTELESIRKANESVNFESTGHKQRIRP